MAKYEESKETPSTEARAHSAGFLKRAEKMARKGTKGRKKSYRKRR